MEVVKIESRHNPRVLRLVELREQRKVREKERLFIIEGMRELECAVEAGVAVREVYFSRPFRTDVAEKLLRKLLSLPSVAAFELSEGAMGKASYRENPEGIIAVAEMRQHTLSDLPTHTFSRQRRSRHTAPSTSSPATQSLGASLSSFPKLGKGDRRTATVEESDCISEEGTACGVEGGRRSRLGLVSRNSCGREDPCTARAKGEVAPPPLFLVAEAIEKPGNIGALLRTADSAGCDGLICCDTVSDIYNPNTIRASRGTIFSVPFALATREEATKWLSERRVNIFATSPTAKTFYWDCNFRVPSAIVLGSEAHGLSPFWLEDGNAKPIAIPQCGQADSLNVSVAAAICLFEAVRQRTRA